MRSQWHHWNWSFGQLQVPQPQSRRLHRGRRSWPVHRRLLRTGCAQLQLRGSCVLRLLRAQFVWVNCLKRNVPRPDYSCRRRRESLGRGARAGKVESMQGECCAVNGMELYWLMLDARMPSEQAWRQEAVKVPIQNYLLAGFDLRHL